MKYYAVRSGRQPGIYESWTDCREQIYQYPGAVYKSFTDKEAAESYLQEQASPTAINDNLPFAFVDGSCRATGGLYGYGGFLYEGGRYHIIQGTGNNPRYVAERNVAGEVIGALQVVFLCQRLGIREINLFFDYAGIEQWAAGNWKTKTELSRYYAGMIDLLKDDITIHFVKVEGHSGIEGNEIADYLAKEAVGAKLRKKDIKALAEFREKAAETVLKPLTMNS